MKKYKIIKNGNGFCLDGQQNLNSKKQNVCTVAIQEDALTIQKNMFFLWFGSEQFPEYAQQSISLFKKANPTFKVFTYCCKDICKSEDPDIIDCLKQISAPHGFCHDYFNRKFAAENLKEKFEVRFSDVFRAYLLNKYGGIYLDCDTTPIKLFDDVLLSYRAFMPMRLDGSSDIFFIGCRKGDAEIMFSWDDEGIEHMSPISDSVGMMDDQLYMTDEKFLMMRDKFFAGELGEDEHFNNSNFYIDHWIAKSWER